MDEIDLSRAELFADCNRGVYIPKHFAESVVRERVRHVDDEQYAILEQGPENDSYWDVWTEVLDSAVLVKDDGSTWVLYQDGDLWLLPQVTS